MITDIAHRILKGGKDGKGESLVALAKEYGMSDSNLSKVLKKHCGTLWYQEFKSEGLNIHEVVPTSVPRLLPDKLIKDVAKKLKARMTFEHGRPKHD
jgi:hypothetical protein